MGKHYETQLPDGYRAAFVVDAMARKTGILLNVVGLAMIIVIWGVSWWIIRPQQAMELSLPRMAGLIAALLVYIVLHELAHGAAYKLLTHHRLTFGLSLSCAYCGVPDLFVYRRAALIALLTPFLLFLPVFLIPAFLLRNAWDQRWVLFLFSMHVGGCAGDLYDAALYLFRLKDPSTLMQDTGPRQTFYVRA